jgi:hypothetical protein
MSVGRVVSGTITPFWPPSGDFLAVQSLGPPAITRDATRPRQFAFGPFRLFPARQLLLEGDSPVRLGGRARDLLLALVVWPARSRTRAVAP